MLDQLWACSSFRQFRFKPGFLGSVYSGFQLISHSHQLKFGEPILDYSVFGLPWKRVVCIQFRLGSDYQLLQPPWIGSSVGLGMSLGGFLMHSRNFATFNSCSCYESW